jgi:hypothetical protein
VQRYRVLLYLGSIGVLFGLLATWYAFAFMTQTEAPPIPFSGPRALDDVRRQVDFGPRIPGSESHAMALSWMQRELTAAGWTTKLQIGSYLDHPLQNLIAFRSETSPEVLLGAHFDSRLHADQDPEPSLRTHPVPGANDGASGVAVLLELARTLPADTVPIWLVFFDAEDNAGIPGWEGLLGSRAFVEGMTTPPRMMVLVDMVGDADLRLPLEGNSDPQLRDSIWTTAAELGHADIFVPLVEYSVQDDHIPFLEAGIPAVDIIDLRYEFWHTTGDLPDRVSSESLQVVGDVLWTWLAALATSSH